MKKKKVGFLLVLLLLLIVCFSLPALGDVGNFNDYGGGSDWGGSYDSGGSWDSDWSGSDNYSFGGVGSDNNNNSGGGSLGTVFTTVIIIMAVAFILAKAKRKRRSNDYYPSERRVAFSEIPDVKNNTPSILPAIKEIDPAFNEDKFIAWSKEVFITMQQAWTERDWAKIRPFEKEELFRQHEIQLQEYIRLGRINVIERININQAYLHKYQRDEDYEALDVYMQVRMVDYIKDEKTGKILKGNPNTDCHLRYLLTFMRKTGVLTDPVKNGQSTVSCPHCGAPTQITSAGQCEYCGFIVTTGEYDWVLANIDGVKPQSQIDNQGVLIRYSPKPQNQENQERE